MKSAGKARSNGLYRHIRTSKEIIRNLLNYSCNNNKAWIPGRSMEKLRTVVNQNRMRREFVRTLYGSR